MSKAKTQKITGVPTVPLTDFGMPVSNRMDDVYGAPNRTVIPADPLAQVEAEELRETLQELREVKARKKAVELKARVEKEKQELEGFVDTSGGGLRVKGMFNFAAEDIATISKMSDPDKQAFFETVRMVQAISAPSAGGQQNAMLWLMAQGGFNRQGQGGLNLRDVVELQNMWKTLYEGAGRGNQDITNQLLLRLLTETVPSLQSQATQNLQMAYQAQINQLQQNQSDPLRDIRFVKELGSELGWRQGSGSDAVALKSLEMENMWHQKEWEFKMNELQDRKRLGYIQQIADSLNLPEIIRGMARDQVRQFTQRPASQPSTEMAGTAATAAAAAGAQPKLIYYTCPNCQGQIVAPETATEAVCPSCGQRIRTLGALK